MPLPFLAGLALTAAVSAGAGIVGELAGRLIPGEETIQPDPEISTLSVNKPLRNVLHTDVTDTPIQFRPRFYQQGPNLGITE